MLSRKRVVIVEDDEIIRSVFVTLINQSDKYYVVSDYSDGESAIKNQRSDKADIYLMDIELPGINGVETLSKLKKENRSVKILVVTVYENTELVFKALCSGAGGYITKNSPPEKIIGMIDELESGGAPMSSSIARMVVSSFHKNYNTPLSQREQEVLELLASGKSYTVIANQLFVDKETIKSHIKNIYIKLEVHSKAEAIDKAKKNKYL